MPSLDGLPESTPTGLFEATVGVININRYTFRQQLSPKGTDTLTGCRSEGEDPRHRV